MTTTTIDMSLPEFLSLPDSEKVSHIRDYAVLFAQQFSRADLDSYCRLAEASRRLHAIPEGPDFMAGLLRNKVALNFFIQPSSRTFLSFNTAQAYLGMRRMSIRDVRISSMSKGESLVDSVRTFISYVDLIVMRHSDGDAGATAFWTSVKSHRRIEVGNEQRPVPVISGGSGTEQHPTQALLDIYTLEKSFADRGGIDGKSLMLVGDLARGRTVRSLSYLMKNYRGVKLYFAAPKKYQMGQDILDFLDNNGIHWEKIGAISDAVADVDAIYMTRIQDEYDDPITAGHVEADRRFVFTLEHLASMKTSSCLMHPLPKRDEIDPRVDYIDDPRVIYWRQERNGMWMRVAIIAKLFKIDGAILEAAR